ncbi:MAG: tetratricopeptide repeat protein, partial [Cyclobacteriaceae bacterium]
MKYVLLTILLTGLALQQNPAQTNSNDSLKKVLQAATDDSVKVQILVALAKAYLNSNNEQALAYSEEAYVLAGKVAGEKLFSEAAYTNGLTHESIGKYVIALELYTSALDQAASLKDSVSIAKIYNGLGRVHHNLGNLTEALKYFQEKLNFIDPRNKMALAVTYNNIGSIHESLATIHEAPENNQKALNYYQESIKLHKQIGNKRHIGGTLINLGVVYYNLGNLDQALGNYHEALEILKDQDDQVTLSILNENIGNVHKKEGAYNKAIVHYNQALRHSESVDDKFGVASINTNLGEIEILNGNHKTALDYLLPAIEISESIGNQKNLMHLYSLASQAFEQSGDYPSALKYNREYASIKDSVFNKDKYSQLSEMEAQFETEMKETKIEALQMDAEIQSLKLQRQKNIRNAVIAASGLGFLLIWGLLRRFRFRQKVKQEQEEKNRLIEEEKRKTAFEKHRVEQLENINNLKDQFLANTSHELRTPLNGIIGMAESLQDGAAGAPTSKMANDLALITASGKRLASLVDSILDFSKLKNHDLQLTLKPLDLRSVVEIIFKLSESLIAGKKVNLENHVPQELPAVTADENRLQQILHNLVGNAIKFTESGSIVVNAKQDDELVSVMVRDSGIGIPKDKVELIFQEFVQADASTTREFVGTGLGLSITKKLVELHGGKIKVDSEVGQGTTFTFT